MHFILHLLCRDLSLFEIESQKIEIKSQIKLVIFYSSNEISRCAQITI